MIVMLHALKIFLNCVFILFNSYVYLKSSDFIYTVLPFTSFYTHTHILAQLILIQLNDTDNLNYHIKQIIMSECLNKHVHTHTHTHKLHIFTGAPLLDLTVPASSFLFLLNMSQLTVQEKLVK